MRRLRLSRSYIRPAVCEKIGGRSAAGHVKEISAKEGTSDLPQ
jgi:hypothetical protein